SFASAAKRDAGAFAPVSLIKTKAGAAPPRDAPRRPARACRDLATTLSSTRRSKSSGKVSGLRARKTSGGATFSPFRTLHGANNKHIPPGGRQMKTLKDVFEHTLQDVYYAENAILKALPEVIDAAG